MEALIGPAIIAALLAAVVARIIYDRRSRKRLAAALRDDRTLMLLHSPTNVVRVRTMGARVVEVRAARSRSGPTVKWFVTGELQSVAARTSLLLEHKTIGDQVADQVGDIVGVHEIATTDAEVDAVVRIRGSVGDIVRGIVCAAPVTDALRLLFVHRRGLSFDLSLDGRFTMCVGSGGVDVDDIRAVTSAAVAFLDVLDAHADAPPMADPGSLGGSVGAGSGTPFVIPLGDGR